MAISRSLMNRQLYANGGIMQVAPREKFGLGSSLKKFVRKIIPNEVAEVATTVAPFVAPFNPAVAAAMSGIGTFDQTGSIGDSLKGGALTYGLGQGARYLGGAGFQGNPFGDGGAFTGGLQGFKGGFSSPIGTETGLGKFFSNRGTEGVQGIDSGRGGDSASALSRSTANAPGAEALASEVSYQAPVVTGSGNNPFGYKDAVTESVSQSIINPTDAAGKSRALGDTILKTTVDKPIIAGSPKQMTITESIQKILSPNSTMEERAGEALNLLKTTGKAAFTKEGKNGPVLDKAAILGALAFTASYAEARALAAETGVDPDLTEAEYDELKKADKQEEYAGYLTNFFAGKKDGGRIGYAFGSEPQDAEVGIMTIDVEAGDDEDEEDMEMAYFPGDVFSKSEITRLFRDKSLTTNTDRKQLFRILMNPGQFPEAEEMLIKMLRGKKDGGRIGYKNGTSDKELEEILATDMTISNNSNDPRNMTTEEIIAVINSGRSTPELFEELLLRNTGGVNEIDMDEGQAFSFNERGATSDGAVENLLFKLRESNPDIYGNYNRPRKFLPIAESRAKGGRIGYKGGANRVSELLILRDEKIGKGEDTSDIDAEIFQLTGKVFNSVGGLSEIPTGQIRKNNAGVIERDYRDEGGFVPVGIKERADDVPAMLSKNEFVMTADAVRGIGNGSVEEGSKKLYKTMKQAEKVGKA